MKYFKSVGLVLVVMVLGAGAVISVQSIRNEQQQEASIYKIPVAANRYVGGSVPVGGGPGHLPGGFLCPSNTQTVTVTSPGLGQTFVSGQNLVVNWNNCGIAANATGTLTVTKIDGSGPVFSSVAITGNVSSHTFAIPAIPGIFDGADSGDQYGTYVAKVTYGLVSGSSSNFQIEYTKTGLEIVWGTQYGPHTSSDGYQRLDTIDLPVVVKAVGHDIYIDKNILYNVPNTSLGGHLLDYTQGVYNPGASETPVPFTATIAALPVLQVTGPVFNEPSIVSNVQSLSNSYLLKAGQQQVLNVHTAISVPSGASCVHAVWKYFSFALSDIHGNISEPVYSNTGGGNCFVQ